MPGRHDLPCPWFEYHSRKHELNMQGKLLFHWVEPIVLSARGICHFIMGQGKRGAQEP